MLVQQYSLWWHLVTIIGVIFLSFPKFDAFTISEIPVVDHELHVECIILRKAVASALDKESYHMN